jgi:hypothetical protein
MRERRKINLAENRPGGDSQARSRDGTNPIAVLHRAHSTLPNIPNGRKDRAIGLPIVVTGRPGRTQFSLDGTNPILAGESSGRCGPIEIQIFASKWVTRPGGGGLRYPATPVFRRMAIGMPGLRGIAGPCHPTGSKPIGERDGCDFLRLEAISGERNKANLDSGTNPIVGAGIGCGASGGRQGSVVRQSGLHFPPDSRAWGLAGPGRALLIYRPRLSASASDDPRASIPARVRSSP